MRNHVTFALSELDMRMVQAVPPGGNWRDIPDTLPSKRLEQIRRTGGRTTLYGRLRWDRPSYTISTYFNRPGNGTYIQPEQDRVLSVREAARLQSFPDDVEFLGPRTAQLKQIGNAVPPLLAYAIAARLRAELGVRTVVDLFCGAGGLSLGFQWAGVTPVLAVDFFNHACATYRASHPSVRVVEGDITNPAVQAEVYSGAGSTEVIAGGPPCQGFSHAGKRLVDDPRNLLFKELSLIHI